MEKQLENSSIETGRLVKTNTIEILQFSDGTFLGHIKEFPHLCSCGKTENEALISLIEDYRTVLTMKQL